MEPPPVLTIFTKPTTAGIWITLCFHTCLRYSMRHAPIRLPVGECPGCGEAHRI
jgi:hypothetical protein